LVRIAALNSCGASTPSPEVSVTIGGPAPIVPNAPSVLTQDVTGASVSLTWASPTAGGETSRYIIEATDTLGTPLATLDTGNAATSFTHGVGGAGVYVVRVRAANAAGVGPASEPVTVVVTPESMMPPSGNCQVQSTRVADRLPTLDQAMWQHIFLELRPPSGRIDGALWARILEAAADWRRFRDAPLRPSGKWGAPLASLKAAMAAHIASALQLTRGRVAGSRGAARRLAVDLPTFNTLMVKLGIDARRFRGGRPPEDAGQCAAPSTNPLS